jgi:hypothetical protein
LRQGAIWTRPSRHEGTPAKPAACCLLIAEPSPEHTSFLQQHHFQDNIQQMPCVDQYHYFNTCFPFILEDYYYFTLVL